MQYLTTKTTISNCSKNLNLTFGVCIEVIQNGVGFIQESWGINYCCYNEQIKFVLTVIYIHLIKKQKTRNDYYHYPTTLDNNHEINSKKIHEIKIKKNLCSGTLNYDPREKIIQLNVGEIKLFEIRELC